MGPISVSVREVTPTTSPGNSGPGLLTTASVTAPTPPAESTTTTTTSSPSGHHSHFQGKKHTYNSKSDSSCMLQEADILFIIQVSICWVLRDPFSGRYSRHCYHSPLGSTTPCITRNSTSWNRNGTLWP